MKIKDMPVNFHLGTFIIVMVSIITATVTGVSAYDRIDNSIKDMRQEHVKITEVYENHEDRLQNVENNNTEIITNQEWIKATLLEIKKDLR